MLKSVKNTQQKQTEKEVPTEKAAVGKIDGSGVKKGEESEYEEYDYEEDPELARADEPIE